MTFEKKKLDNGLRLVKVPMKGTQTVTVLVLVGTGTNYERKENNGISHFLEHMFFKGSEKRPSTLAIARDLDSIGADYNAFTSREHTGYYVKSDLKHLNLGLEVVADILQNPLFPEPAMQREKGVIMEEINMYSDTPMQYVSMLFEKLLYGDQPAGWLTLGTKENVSDFKREDLLSYMKKQYVSLNTLVVVAGNLEKNSFQEIADYFQQMVKGQPKKKLPVKQEQNKFQKLVKKKKVDQTHLCLGVPGYDIKHKDRYVFSVLGTLLGGMMSSRIWLSLREKAGLAYYVQTQAQKRLDSGYLVTQAGVDSRQVNKAVEIILNEYKKVTKELVDKKELKKVKECLKARTRLQLEASDDVASWVGVQELLKEEILQPEEVFEKIDSVSQEDIQRVAQDIFKEEKLNLAVICPEEVEVDTPKRC